MSDCLPFMDEARSEGHVRSCDGQKATHWCRSSAQLTDAKIIFFALFRYQLFKILIKYQHEKVKMEK